MDFRGLDLDPLDDIPHGLLNPGIRVVEHRADQLQRLPGLRGNRRFLAFGLLRWVLGAQEAQGHQRSSPHAGVLVVKELLQQRHRFGSVLGEGPGDSRSALGIGMRQVTGDLLRRLAPEDAVASLRRAVVCEGKAHSGKVKHCEAQSRR